MNGGGEGKLYQAAASILPGCLLAPAYRCLSETCFSTRVITRSGPGQAEGAEI